jgi:phage/plasmid-associated DNA primase
MCFAVRYRNPNLLAVRNCIVTDFVKDVFGNDDDDRDLIEYVQRFTGCCTTHYTGEQCWVAFASSGSNGKSMFVVLLGEGITHQFVYGS